jgi:hypothetical protein
MNILPLVLKMEAVCSPKILVPNYMPAQHNNPKDHHRLHSRENLKSHTRGRVCAGLSELWQEPGIPHVHKISLSEIHEVENTMQNPHWTPKLDGGLVFPLFTKS